MGQALQRSRKSWKASDLGRHSLGFSLLCPAVPDRTMVLIGTHWLSNKYYPRELGGKGSMQEKSDKDLGETRT